MYSKLSFCNAFRKCGTVKIDPRRHYIHDWKGIQPQYQSLRNLGEDPDCENRQIQIPKSSLEGLPHPQVSEIKLGLSGKLFSEQLLDGFRLSQTEFDIWYAAHCEKLTRFFFKRPRDYYVHLKKALKCIYTSGLEFDVQRQSSLRRDECGLLLSDRRRH